MNNIIINIKSSYTSLWQGQCVELIPGVVRAIDRCAIKTISCAMSKVKVHLLYFQTTIPAEHTDRNHFHLCWYKSQKIIFAKESADGILKLQSKDRCCGSE